MILVTGGLGMIGAHTAQGRITVAPLDITRLTEDAGFTPAFDIPAAVTDYVAWRADNPR